MYQDSYTQRKTNKLRHVIMTEVPVSSGHASSNVCCGVHAHSVQNTGLATDVVNRAVNPFICLCSLIGSALTKPCGLGHWSCSDWMNHKG